jgi:aspartate kinase
MIVMKFGGSSVADGERIRQVAANLRGQLPRRPLVVVSALQGVTDALFEQARQAVQGSHDLRPLRERHRAVLASLGLSEDLLEAPLRDLDDLLRGISLVGEITPRSLDHVAGFGERLSVLVVAAHFREAGIPARPHRAPDLGLVTDSHYGAAAPISGTRERIRRLVADLPREEVPVVTGYIGRDAAGHFTTLGRNGSDATAAIFGEAVKADEIQIWTDVDGILTADPRLVPEARTVPQVSFEEASELAHFGAKVLHPASILPAIQGRIPVRVLNTGNPDGPSTLVLERIPDAKTPFKAVASKPNQVLVHLISTRLLPRASFLARVFEVFSRVGLQPDLLAASEVSLTCTCDSDRNLTLAAGELRGICEVRIVRGVAVVAVVGEGLRTRPAQGEVFHALARDGVPVTMVSQGAGGVHLGLVVDGSNLARALKALHRAFFEEERGTAAAVVSPASAP